MNNSDGQINIINGQLETLFNVEKGFSVESKEYRDLVNNEINLLNKKKELLNTKVII